MLSTSKQSKLKFLYITIRYRNLPNRGAGRDSKVKSDTMEYKLWFWAFQRWFRIENWSIIKGNTPILVPLYNIGSPKLWGGGAPLLGVVPVIGRIRYVNEKKRKSLSSWESAPGYFHAELSESGQASLKFPPTSPASKFLSRGSGLPW